MADQKEEDDATELDGALGDVDNKVEQLISSTSSNILFLKNISLFFSII